MILEQIGSPQCCPDHLCGSFLLVDNSSLWAQKRKWLRHNFANICFLYKYIYICIVVVQITSYVVLYMYIYICDWWQFSVLYWISKMPRLHCCASLGHFLEMPFSKNDTTQVNNICQGTNSRATRKYLAHPQRSHNKQLGKVAHIE